jgi:hypothetical protein
MTHTGFMTAVHTARIDVYLKASQHTVEAIRLAALTNTSQLTKKYLK